MKIPHKVQEDIISEINDMIIMANADRQLQESGSNLWTYDNGRINGLISARIILSSWNLPNHGKVIAKTHTPSTATKFEHENV